jgi:hypothetical protein
VSDEATIRETLELIAAESPFMRWEDDEARETREAALAALARLVAARETAIQERDEARKWANTMEHERDWERDVVQSEMRARLERVEAARDELIEATRCLIRSVERENFNRPARAPEVGSGLRVALRKAGEAVGAALSDVTPPPNEPGSSAAVVDTDADAQDATGPETVGERQGRRPGSLGGAAGAVDE